MTKSRKNAPRVYSYIRFSTPEQELGDSLRRQFAKAKAWADERKLELDITLKPDRGLSGYKGHHRTKGQLGSFLRWVETGDVPTGSILLVENIDRLGREDPLQALETITGIIKHGITIVTLTPYAEYTRESLRGGLIYLLVGQIQMAHEESAKKSERIRAARDQSRMEAREAGGKKITKMCPAWLRLRKDRTSYGVIEPAAKAVRMIFEQKAKGLGTNALVKYMNAKAPWRPDDNPVRPKKSGNGWVGGYIKKILTNPAVIGVYQPHVKRDGKRSPVGDPMPGYYPAIVPATLYHAVQNALASNRGRGGRTGTANNLLPHIARCAYCGGAMAFVGKGKTSKGGNYLVCDNGRREVRDKDGKRIKCNAYHIRYNEVQTVLLENCHRLRPEQVLPREDAQEALCGALRERVAGAIGELAATEDQIGRLVDQIATTESKAVRDRYEAKVVVLSARQVELEEEREAARRELAAAERTGQSFTKWKAGLADLKQALAAGDVETRLRLRAHLREFIDRVDVFAVGYKRRYDATGKGGRTVRGKAANELPLQDADDYEGELEEALRQTELATGKTAQRFIEFVMGRRMSRHGRFIRVHFTTGAVMDLVPAGSIASGDTLGHSGTGSGVVRPPIEQLWRRFKRQGMKVE